MLYQNVRYEPKTFRARRPDPARAGEWIWNLQEVKRVPYRLPELRNHAIDNRPDNPIFINEGEKDVDSVRGVGLAATTTIGGHGQRAQWNQPGFTDPFKGLHVVLIPDNDTAGLEFANCVATALLGVAATIKVLKLTGANVKDAHDWLSAGGTREILLELANQAEWWQQRTEANATEESLEPHKIPRTELGNAERFLNRHGADVRHCSKSGWYVWDGKRWKGDSEKDVVEKMKDTVLSIEEEAVLLAQRREEGAADMSKWCNTSQTYSRINAALKLACSDPQISLGMGDFDADPMLLNLENGTFDLRTHQLRQHSKGDNITRLSRTNFCAAAECPEFLKFIERILPDADIRAFVQRWFGYCLTGDNGEQRIFIAHGEGANGKSQLLELMRKLVGPDYAMRSIFETFRRNGKHGETRNDLARFKGIRHVLTSESGEGVELDESLIKEVTGGDAITARFLYGEFFDFVPQFKLTFSTNHKPEIHGTDHAIWRRICLVPFELVIPEREREENIHERLLRDEASGILNWLLVGLRDQQEAGLNPPRKILAATEEYRSEEDIVGQFLRDRCEIGAGFAQQSSELHEAYSKYAEKNGYKALNQKGLNNNLRRKGYKSGHKTSGTVWEGLRVNSFVSV